MAQTIKQYIASIRQVSGCPDDLRTQVNAWPWPQAEQSHIAVWRAAWQEDPMWIPNQYRAIYLDDSDRPGVPMRIRPGSLSPRALIADLLAG